MIPKSELGLALFYPWLSQLILIKHIELLYIFNTFKYRLVGFVGVINNLLSNIQLATNNYFVLSSCVGAMGTCRCVRVYLWSTFLNTQTATVRYLSLYVWGCHETAYITTIGGLITLEKHFLLDLRLWWSVIHVNRECERGPESTRKCLFFNLESNFLSFRLPLPIREFSQAKNDL